MEDKMYKLISILFKNCELTCRKLTFYFMFKSNKYDLKSRGLINEKNEEKHF